MKSIGEFEIIERLARFAGPSQGVLVGVGDDAAVFKQARKGYLVATCDIQVEGVHFVLTRMNMEQLGRRAAAVNLSDIAAMGAVPRFALVSLGIPEEVGAEDLERMYSGLQGALSEHGAVIVGGNTSACPQGLIVDVTLLGEVEEEHLLTRSGASVGDVLCVTGLLGGSAAGLRYLEESSGTTPTGAIHMAIGRHLEPTARVREGCYLGEQKGVSACMDISDGLLQDAGHMARCSDVEIQIDPDAVPVDPAALEITGSKETALEMALTGGEDFELLFTVEEKVHCAVLKELFEITGVEARSIGRIVREYPGGKVTGTQDLDFARRGFDHFR